MLTVLPIARSSALTLAALAALSALSTAAHAEAVVGLTSTNALVRFDSASPLTASAPVTITGLLGSNEQVLGIDRRPVGNVLFGLGSSGRLYTLNETTGVIRWTPTETPWSCGKASAKMVAATAFTANASKFRCAC